MPPHDAECSSLVGRAQNVLPASEYLQQRLSERRARQGRPKHARHTDVGPRPGRDDDIFFAEAGERRHSRMYDSSPMSSLSTPTVDAAAQSGESRRRRTIGVRDLGDQLDRLNKQNFALKLELDHRRAHTQKLQQQVDTMQNQVARAELLQEEHKELMRINSQLVQELERRDKAVEEAINHICELEERLHDMEERNSNTRPSTAHADSGYAGTVMHDPEVPSSPPQADKPKTSDTSTQVPLGQASAASQALQGLLDVQTPAKPRREPSVLSMKKPSTQALRSVYLENANSLHPVKSFQSLLSRQEAKTEDEGDEFPNSPRLSVLSESSFPSIYSPKDTGRADQHTWEAGDDAEASNVSLGSCAHMRHDSIKRVNQWMSDGDAAETPSKSKNISVLLQSDVEQGSSPLPCESPHRRYRSLKDAISTARGSPTLTGSPARAMKIEPHLRKQKPRALHRPASFGGPVLGDLTFPPTPVSASSRMLRVSRSSIADDGTLPKDTPAVVNNSSDSEEPGMRTAPRQMRSSVEMRDAFASNLQHRKAVLDGLRGDESSDEDYVRQDADARSDTIKDFYTDYDGFPDGASIALGIPSRFMRCKPPADIMFNRGDMSPSLKPGSPPLMRRQSSAHFTHHSLGSRPSGMETSSTMSVPMGRIISGEAQSSFETMTRAPSGASQRSGSTSNRTIVPSDNQSGRGLSPEVNRRRSVGIISPSRSRTSPSPARALGQALLRRLSSTPSEKPPLPTLTTTPSSAYVNTVPTRPQTSHTDRSVKSLSIRAMATRSPGSCDTIRPSLQIRNKPEAANERPASAAGTEKERRRLFGRNNSVKDGQAGQSSDTGGRAGPPKRRGSLRDAVTYRRPWRA